MTNIILIETKEHEGDKLYKYAAGRYQVRKVDHACGYTSIEVIPTDRSDRYHNKTFKAEAEARDLEIGYDRTVGFSHTSPTDAFKKTLEENGFVLEVPFARVPPKEKAKAEREKPHRYVCPICGQEVKTTADLSLICGVCEVPMSRAD